MTTHFMNSMTTTLLLALIIACSSHSDTTTSLPEGGNNTQPGEAYAGDAFEITHAAVKYEMGLDAFLFTIETKADAASVAPIPAGQVNGAPVLGYVFLTDLDPSDIGFLNVAGTVALAVTSHPDFDDTPLWDENSNDLYDDDGIVYHSHWVILEENSSASAGLAVVQANESDVLKPTSPMPMYLDSPGFSVLEKGSDLHVIVPANAVKRRADFTTNALTAYLEVDTTGTGPLLKVERVYNQFAQELQIEQRDLVPTSHWPVASVDGDDSSLKLSRATVDYFEEIDSLVFTMETVGKAAIKTVEVLGQVDGAPVLGYVFPTTIPTSNVGFKNIQHATLALAVTTHPDFDDTPFWDENGNDNYQDDGIVYHTHWVALVADENSGAGLSVPSAFNTADLPPTAPMPMYLDSPNFHAFAQGNLLRVVVPVKRVDGMVEFNFDAVTAAMNVDLSGNGPVLRVNKVLDLLSGDLSLPFSVTRKPFFQD